MHWRTQLSNPLHFCFYWCYHCYQFIETIPNDWEAKRLERSDSPFKVWLVDFIYLLAWIFLCNRTPTGAPSGQRDLSGKATSAGPMPASVPVNMDTSVMLSEDGGKACEGCLGGHIKCIQYELVTLLRVQSFKHCVGTLGVPHRRTVEFATPAWPTGESMAASSYLQSGVSIN